MTGPTSILRNALDATLDVAFPPRCAACGSGVADTSGRGDRLCGGCLEDLDLFDGPVCSRCASPLAIAGAAGEDCPLCRAERWAFDATVALGPYEGLLRRFVLDGKRRPGEATLRALGVMLGRRAATAGLDLAETLVVPVPSHWSRRLAQGADSAGTLADAVAVAAGLRRYRLLRRSRATPKQTSVAPSDRPANVRGAFACRRPAAVAGRCVWLVDDVMTSGSTCHAAARVLKRAGATRVVAVVAARRLRPR